MAKEQPKKVLIEILLNRVVSHPLQAALYLARTEWQIQEIATSMAANGQLEAVEVTPKNVILSGHGRVAAAKSLGWKTIRCWVRHDLAAVGPEAEKQRLVEANLERRHLSRLDLVRSYAQIKRLARDQIGWTTDKQDLKGDLRDLIAERFGVSGRTLDRWLQILELPLAIQEAVDAGRLALTLAVKVAALAPVIRDRIAQRVREGENPTAAVKEGLPGSGARNRKPVNVVASFVALLGRGLVP